MLRRNESTNAFVEPLCGTAHTLRACAGQRPRRHSANGGRCVWVRGRAGSGSCTKLLERRGGFSE